MNKIIEWFCITIAFLIGGFLVGTGNRYVDSYGLEREMSALFSLIGVLLIGLPTYKILNNHPKKWVLFSILIYSLLLFAFGQFVRYISQKVQLTQNSEYIEYTVSLGMPIYYITTVFIFGSKRTNARGR